MPGNRSSRGQIRALIRQKQWALVKATSGWKRHSHPHGSVISPTTDMHAAPGAPHKTHKLAIGCSCLYLLSNSALYCNVPSLIVINQSSAPSFSPLFNLLIVLVKPENRWFKVNDLKRQLQGISRVLALTGQKLRHLDIRVCVHSILSLQTRLMWASQRKQRLQFKSPVPEIEATNGDWCCQDLPTMLAWFIVSLKTLLVSHADILSFLKKKKKKG